MKQTGIEDDIFELVLPRSKSKSDEKKRRILEAAIEILADQGIETITFEAVGDKLKTTKANIRYHFQSKDDLIFMAIKFMAFTAQHITAHLVEEAQTAQEKLNAVILGAYRHLKSNPTHVRAFMMYFYYASLFSNYSEFFTQSRLTGQLRLIQILQDLPRKKGPCSAKVLGALSEQIQNLITGQILGVVLLDGSFTISSLQTQNMIRAILLSEGIDWQAQ
jgi:AcrR family transcriptional regulator